MLLVSVVLPGTNLLRIRNIIASSTYTKGWNQRRITNCMSVVEGVILLLGITKAYSATTTIATIAQINQGTPRNFSCIRILL